MNRIRAYRDIEGISQQEVGDKLGISPQMVSAIESGRRVFAGDIAPLGYSNERIDLPPMSEPLHRTRASTSVTDKKRAHELLRLGGEVFAELVAHTDKAPRLTLERVGPVGIAELEDCAVDFRYSLGHEERGPIMHLTAAVELAGVCVIPLAGLRGIDGMSSWVGDVPVIGLAPSAPGDRFRLSLGHEMGHLLFHRKRTDTSESEANRFAGALLIPLADFGAAMPERPQLKDFIGLKSTWGVSIAALVYRAHELNYIDDQRYRALQIQMSKWQKDEPGQFDAAPGQLLRRLIDANGGLDKVAKKLGVNRGHLGELVNWSHLRLT